MKRNFKLLLVVLGVFLFAFSVSASIDPSSFTATYVDNFTAGGGDPTMRNDSRGFIHVMNINKTQQTPRWKAYVGNITGELALADGDTGYSIFNWDLSTVTGEIYATRYNGNQSAGNLRQGEEPHRLPIWSTMECANQSEVNLETTRLNHNYGLDVDALNRTFVSGLSFLDFTVGNNRIDTGSCFGTFLNWNGTNENTEQGADGWQQVVLTDRADGNNANPDLMYASLLKNEGLGFNTQLYDYQILLPDDGDMSQDGGPSNTPYYFYIELLGETN